MNFTLKRLSVIQQLVLRVTDSQVHITRSISSFEFSVGSFQFYSLQFSVFSYSL